MTVRKIASKKPGENRAEQEILALAGTGEKVFSVSVFLDLVNTGLRTFRAKIKGEVSSAIERNGHWYFDLKDSSDGSVISCLIWRSNYRLSGVPLKEGMELTASGFPAVYKPNGRLSFQAESIELVGEGALKKQFEELKAKLAAEGLFSPERKKPIPLFPEKIGLITSRQGEAIHDFLTNLGRFGFQISFIDSRVEGTQAVPSLLSAVRAFRKKDIDVLVLVRGGGSLESLLSFNNEFLVREIAAFPKPVVSGIGHEQDVSLVDLAADRSCSTPTGTAKLLSYGWEQARFKVDLAEKHLRSGFREQLNVRRQAIYASGETVKKEFRRILAGFLELSFRLRRESGRLAEKIGAAAENLEQAAAHLRIYFRQNLGALHERLRALEKVLSLADPKRQLALGFSLAYRAGGRVLRSVKDVSPGEEIELQLADGTLPAVIKEKRNGSKK